MSKSINHQFFFPHKPEVVWEYLTNADLLELWLMKNDFEPVVGRDFQFRTKPIPSLNIDGIMQCRVLELVPLQKLSYTWQAGPGDGSVSLDTKVLWTLRQTDKGTELTLVHSGFTEIENLAIYNGMTQGWLQNIDKIFAHLNAARQEKAAG